jgi:rare lipoprotein A
VVYGRTRASKLWAAVGAMLTLTAGPVSICRAAGPSPSSTNRAIPGKVITGKATIYPNRLVGHKTASGTKFHQSDHTAAANTLPLGTDVKVTSLKTGESTSVKLTDRGPALGSHKIDLSKRAAGDIGLTPKQGTVPVKIKVTQPTQRQAGAVH